MWLFEQKTLEIIKRIDIEDYLKTNGYDVKDLICEDFTIEEFKAAQEEIQSFRDLRFNGKNVETLSAQLDFTSYGAAHYSMVIEEIIEAHNEGVEENE